MNNVQIILYKKCMIKYIQKGNIFDSWCQALVNPVNCQGIMGAGLALEFKDRYPEMFKEYKYFCESGLIVPKFPFLHSLGDEKYIVSFPTKNRINELSKIDYIQYGMRRLVILLNNEFKNINSVAIPSIGCGLGGLDWEVVKPVIEKEILNCNRDTLWEIYEPI